MALHKDVRRQRAFEAFQRRLDQASPGEIRAMLAQRRIRSPERIELAETRLRRHEAAASGTGAAAAPARRRYGDDGHDQRRTTQAPRAAIREEVPLARQIGRLLGIGLGILGIAAIAVLGSRR